MSDKHPQTTKWYVDAYTPKAPEGFPENTWGPYDKADDVTKDVCNVINNPMSGISRIYIRRIDQ
jgi:hypothetical protein